MRISMIRRERGIDDQITLRHGIFLPPFHPMRRTRRACLDRDLELMVWLDRLGFHEACDRRASSAGFEIISSPEIFIAIAADGPIHPLRHRRHLIALPPDPLMSRTDRAARPSHARPIMFGAGRGFLPRRADARDDPMTSATGCGGIDVILRLFRDETVTEKTDWYTLVNARLHLPPYTKPYPKWRWSVPSPPLAAASPEIRSQHDLRRRDQPVRYDALASKLADRLRHRGGARPRDDPARLASCWPMHIAEPREGLCERPFRVERYLNYLNNNQLRSSCLPARTRWNVCENKYGVVGTPDDAIALISGCRRSRASSASSSTGHTGRLGGDETLLLLMPLCDATFSAATTGRAPTRTTGAPSTATSSVKARHRSPRHVDKHEDEQRAAIHRRRAP